MQAISLLSILLPLSLASNQYAEFKLWSKKCDVFQSFSIPNSQLNADEVLNILPPPLKLDSAHPLTIRVGQSAALPPMVGHYFEAYFTLLSGANDQVFPNAQILYQLLRLLNHVKANLTSPVDSRETSDLLLDIINVDDAVQLTFMDKGQATNWVNGVIARRFPGTSAVPVKGSDIEWLLRLKAQQHADVRQALESTDNKCILYGVTSNEEHLAIRYISQTQSYQGKNILGKAWMNVRDRNSPLFLDEWYRDLDAGKREINTSVVHPWYMKATDQDDHLLCLEMCHSGEILVNIAETDIIPEDIRNRLATIQRDFRQNFPSADSLLQFIRLIRFSGVQIPLHLNSLIGIGVDCRATKRYVDGLIGNQNFMPDHDDVEWILRLKAATRPEVMRALESTRNGYIICNVCMWTGMQRRARWGMTRTNPYTYEGCNYLGKMWTKIRDHPTQRFTQPQNQTSAQPQSQASTQPRVPPTRTTQSAQPQSVQPSTQPARTTQSVSTGSHIPQPVQPRVQSRAQPVQARTENTTPQVTRTTQTPQVNHVTPQTQVRAQPTQVNTPPPRTSTVRTQPQVTPVIIQPQPAQVIRPQASTVRTQPVRVSPRRAEIRARLQEIEREVQALQAEADRLRQEDAIL